MRTMHVALSLAAERLGMQAIVPDATGFAELEVEEAFSVFLRVVDEYEAELSARLPEFGTGLGREVTEALLVWNGRFRGLRFALEPVGGGVVLGRRVDIRLGAPDALGEAVEGFVLAVADWRKSGAAELLARVKQHAEPAFGAQMTGLYL